MYLCLEQGMNPEQITILATYTAQMHAITDVRRRNSKLKMLEKVRITVVDNFQGEENDVIYSFSILLFVFSPVFIIVSFSLAGDYTFFGTKQQSWRGWFFAHTKSCLRCPFPSPKWPLHSRQYGPSVESPSALGTD